jgi:hypothetical protein
LGGCTLLAGRATRCSEGEFRRHHLNQGRLCLDSSILPTVCRPGAPPSADLSRFKSVLFTCKAKGSLPAAEA